MIKSVPVRGRGKGLALAIILENRYRYSANVRFELETTFAISCWTVSGSFRLALIKVVTSDGGVIVS